MDALTPRQAAAVRRALDAVPFDGPGAQASAAEWQARVSDYLKRRAEAARAVLVVPAPAAPPPAKPPRRRDARIAFERSQAWRELSADVRRLSPVCARCGATDRLQADHIKPKSRYPHLALDRANLQVLCWPCNKAKAAR